MPGHHRVRFADIPSTPSSTFSDASLASSPGPATPPSLLSTPLPSKHRRTPSPLYYPASPIPGAVQVHPALACAPGVGAPLTWDLALPVDTALVRSSSNVVGPMSSTLATEAATMPKLASITIISEQLPWSITVTPKPDAPWAAPYVTVGDVLYTLYRALRLAVTHTELAMCDLGHQQRVHNTFFARWTLMPVARESERMLEKDKGIKRVDFLCDTRMFRGLSLVPEGNSAKGLAPGVVWRLHVARP